MEVLKSNNCPVICDGLKEDLDNVEDYMDYAFAIQLAYRDAHSIFFLDEIKAIKFHDEFVEIRNLIGSVVYFDYNEILEYAVINHSQDLEDWLA